MLSWSYKGGFFGNSNWCGKNGCLNRTGDKPLRSIGKAATSVLPPLTTLSLFSTQELVIQVSLWSRVRALPTLSGPRLFQLQKQTCQKLWPLRALEFEARLLLPSLSSKGNIPRTVHSSIHRETPFRQLPKAADASQPLGFDKPSSLRILPILRILMYNNLMARGINEYKNGYDFYKDSETDQIWQVDNHGQEGPYLFSFDQKTVFNFWTDYPDKLTPEQIEIFKKENPTMAELK